MKFNQLTMAVLSFVAIAIMVIPAFAVSQIDSNTETNILSVEGLYNDGTDIGSNIAPDKTEMESMIGNVDVIGSDSNNDSALIRLNSGSNNDDIYYGDYITYLGNNSYIITPDYTDNPETTPTYNTNIRIPLDITPQEIIDSDFVKINTNFECNYYLAFQNDITSSVYLWISQVSTNDTLIWIPTLTYKSQLANSLNSSVYLFIGGLQGNNGMDSEPVSITYNIESFTLSVADSFEVSDTTLYFLMVLSLDVIFTIAFVFTTDSIDIFFDKNRKNKR